ncbi:protein of unknown function (plasmid) [Cupriavidus taiwanensis]|uniref:Uncharacterized protein n=1 Tax=Cupriavidus taiwanensis TaxID=164546 RepID=A0A375FGB7_9BURK|nr:protein of unknown function [Cupriavidus taiwanensis]SOZ72114.1 protein of unknown function [Cupriavidus taiwanensis]SOZ74406.1 protein of unknown function [Cupriavidus taiwanensis]SPA03313.1 protein of unknown function [Cupriavidus taiwanensis]SPA11287.1 protein of unknown function [Cupriavidus taiwanensis]
MLASPFTRVAELLPWAKVVQSARTPLESNLLVTNADGRAVVLAHWSTREIQAVANALNSRPRRIAWLATAAKAVDENL